MNVAARYLSLFLVRYFQGVTRPKLTFLSYQMAQAYTGFIVFCSWCSNTLPHPPSKRAAAIALINSFSQIGNVAGSYVWPSKWGKKVSRLLVSPRYIPVAEMLNSTNNHMGFVPRVAYSQL